jgi:hypothetical protein
MRPLLEELALGVRAGILSAVQLDIVVKRTCDCGQRIWDRLAARFRLSGPSVLVRAFIRTTCGLFWAPGMPGGRDPYLSDLDLIKFREQALERAQDLRCMKP